MDKTKIFINLSECTEEERNHIFSLLPDDELRTYLRYNKFQPYLNFDFLQWFICSHEVISRKTELTYPEFIKLFEGGESKEVLQVENNGWISVENKLPSEEGEYLIYKENDPIEVKYYDLKQWGYYHSADEHPTHWMPLPEAPKF